MLKPPKIHSPTKVREQNFIHSFFIEFCCLTLLILNDIQWVQIVRVQFKDPEKTVFKRNYTKSCSPWYNYKHDEFGDLFRCYKRSFWLFRARTWVKKETT